jgi:hypothetical protein
LILCLFNHYSDGEKLLTKDKLLYELDNLVLFEPLQPTFSDFPKTRMQASAAGEKIGATQGAYPHSHFLFTRPLKNTLAFITGQQLVLKETEVFYMIWDMVEEVLKQTTMKAFVEEI